MFSAVFFDLDGTLLDTVHDLTHAVNLTLDALGYPHRQTPEVRRFTGRGASSLMARALPGERPSQEEVRQATERFLAHYAGCWARQSAPYPGVPELLDRLTAARLPMAVLSNKPERFTRNIVETLLPGWSFALVRGAREGVPLKPDPTALLDMIQAMDLTPARCAFVGDSGIDLETARRAGLTPLGVTWGFRDPPELRASGATRLYETPEALGEALLAS